MEPIGFKPYRTLEFEADGDGGKLYADVLYMIPHGLIRDFAIELELQGEGKVLYKRKWGISPKPPTGPRSVSEWEASA